MNTTWRLSGSVLALIVATSLIEGCAFPGGGNHPVIPTDHGTLAAHDDVGARGGVSDIVVISAKIARRIKEYPPIAEAPGTSFIVLQPADNQTSYPINTENFMAKLRAALVTRALPRVRFVDREEMEKIRQGRGPQRTRPFSNADEPTNQELNGADYFLTGTLQGMAAGAAAGTSDYLLYTFRLVNIRTSEIVWQDSSEIRKKGLTEAEAR